MPKVSRVKARISNRRKEPEQRRIRIVIADDHVAVREGLRSMLDRQSDMRVVGEAENGLVAVAQVKEHSPDILLIDLRMPEMDGMAAIMESRRIRSGTKIVVLTSFSTEHEIACALRAGVNGCLLKDAPREDLFACIRSVDKGNSWVAAELTTQLAAGLSNQALTERESEVLGHVARGKSNKEIAAIIFVSEATVKSHMRSLFSKLRVYSRTGAVAAASQRGLVQL